MTLTRDLTEAQREAAEARALKKCRFGRQHGWCTELDLAGDGHFTGWFVCYDCGAREVPSDQLALFEEVTAA